MAKAGVYDPESKEGIEFCTQYCPYPYCIVFESKLPKKDAAQLLRKVAKDLHAQGIGTKDIAVILGKSYHTIRGYLKS